MPTIDRPSKPRPKELTTNDSKYSYVSCADPIDNGTEIFDWNGSIFVATPTGTYTFNTIGSLDVVNGIIQ